MSSFNFPPDLESCQVARSLEPVKNWPSETFKWLWSWKEASSVMKVIKKNRWENIGVRSQGWMIWGNHCCGMDLNWPGVHRYLLQSGCVGSTFSDHTQYYCWVFVCYYGWDNDYDYLEQVAHLNRNPGSLLSCGVALEDWSLTWIAVHYFALIIYANHK